MKKWIYNKALGFPQCPHCKKWIHVFQTAMTMNFCPDCGTPLDGEDLKKNLTVDGHIKNNQTNRVK